MGMGIGTGRPPMPPLWALGYLPALGIVGVVEMLLPGSHMVSVDYR